MSKIAAFAELDEDEVSYFQGTAQSLGDLDKSMAQAGRWSPPKTQNTVGAHTGYSPEETKLIQKDTFSPEEVRVGPALRPANTNTTSMQQSPSTPITVNTKTKSSVAKKLPIRGFGNSSGADATATGVAVRPSDPVLPNFDVRPMMTKNDAENVMMPSPPKVILGGGLSSRNNSHAFSNSSESRRREGSEAPQLPVTTGGLAALMSSSRNNNNNNGGDGKNIATAGGITYNFDEYDDDTSASPPRVPPGMTPKSDDNSNSSGRYYNNNNDYNTRRREESEESALGISTIHGGGGLSPMMFGGGAVGKSNNSNNNNNNNNNNNRQVTFSRDLEKKMSPPTGNDRPNFAADDEYSPEGFNISALVPTTTGYSDNFESAVYAKDSKIASPLAERLAFGYANQPEPMSPPTPKTTGGAGAGAGEGVVTSPIADRLAFGFASKNNNEVGVEEKKTSLPSPPSLQQQQQQQKNSSAPTTDFLQLSANNNSNSTTAGMRPTALQLLQKNMTLSGGDSDASSDLRGFVKGLKDEKGKPVRMASASPERSRANAFLDDLELPPPSVSSSHHPVTSNHNSAVKSASSTNTSPIRPPSMPPPTTALSSSATKNPANNNIFTIPSHDPEVPTPEASPGTRAMQKWQIDQTPASAVPGTLASSSASPSKTSPGRGGGGGGGYANFPFLPTQNVSGADNKSNNASPSRGVILTKTEEEEFAPDTPAKRPGTVAGGVTMPTSNPRHRLAQAYLAERAKKSDYPAAVEIVDGGAVLTTPERLASGAAGAVGGSVSDGLVRIGDPKNQLHATAVIDMSAAAAVTATDAGDLSPSRSGWTTRKWAIVVTVAVGIVIITVLAIVGFIFGL